MNIVHRTKRSESPVMCVLLPGASEPTHPAEDQKRNSPALTPCTNAVHSSGVKLSGSTSGRFESRMRYWPSNLATSTHCPPLQLLLRCQRGESTLVTLGSPMVSIGGPPWSISTLRT